MKRIICLLLPCCLVVIALAGCSKNAGSTAITKTVTPSTSISKTPKQSQNELYQDVFLTLLSPYIQRAIANYYGQSFTMTPICSPDYEKVLNVERPMGYRSFSFIITLQIEPYVGPHDPVGVDQLTIDVNPGVVKVEKFEHIKSYRVPPNYN